MRSILALLCATLLLGVPPNALAQATQPSSGEPAIRVTSRLVFLDITVVDRKGNPVTAGLTKDDFTITEDKRPQTIFSFEAPATHILDNASAEDQPAREPPVTILVLDQLNSSFEDFAFIRDSVKKYLLAQPPQLVSPAELLVLGNSSLEMLQGYTRSREELLAALANVPVALPYKHMSERFFTDDLLQQSLFALQEIALQNKGVPGRKNIVWVGHGSPNLFMTIGLGGMADKVRTYMHSTTNKLVDARISLFVIYPGLKIDGAVNSANVRSANLDLRGNDSDPFFGNVNFGVLVNETGGLLYYNRNDIDREIENTQLLGGSYYTLTYQPHGGNDNGRFRRIRVTFRNPDLRVITKSGYFAPGKDAPVDPTSQVLTSMSEALSATIPIGTLHPSLLNLVRHPDTTTADFTLRIRSKSLPWTANRDGSSSSIVAIAGCSLSGRSDFLASRVQGFELHMSRSSDRNKTVLARLTLRLRIPAKTHAVRLVVQSLDGQHIGTIDVDRQTIDAAPAAPTSEPQLVKSGASFPCRPSAELPQSNP